MKVATVMALVAAMSVTTVHAADAAAAPAMGDKAMPSGEPAKVAKPKAAKKGDKAVLPACDGKDSKGMPCAADAAPADEVDHAAHHPQPPAK